MRKVDLLLHEDIKKALPLPFLTQIGAVVTTEYGPDKGRNGLAALTFTLPALP